MASVSYCFSVSQEDARNDVADLKRRAAARGQAFSYHMVRAIRAYVASEAFRAGVVEEVEEASNSAE